MPACSPRTSIAAKSSLPTPTISSERGSREAATRADKVLAISMIALAPAMCDGWVGEAVRWERR